MSGGGANCGIEKKRNVGQIRSGRPWKVPWFRQGVEGDAEKGTFAHKNDLPYNKFLHTFPIMNFSPLYKHSNLIVSEFLLNFKKPLLKQDIIVTPFLI
jgi:hypothetical protein